MARTLSDLIIQIPDATENGARAAARRQRDATVPLVPVRTGRLQNGVRRAQISVRSVFDGFEAVYSSRVPYDGVVNSQQHYHERGAEIAGTSMREAAEKAIEESLGL